MSSRRDFIRDTALIGAGILAGGMGALQAGTKTRQLVILHTNDWHSRIEPFEMDGSRYQGQGGAARRATLISTIRKENDNVLLLDSGDIFQGTPYFNYYGGELEYKLMTQMGYDCSTLGNHDFDAGLDGLLKQLPHAGFDIVCSNYDFSETILKDRFKPYKIIKKGGIKTGIIGLGIELKGLVPDKLYGNTGYLDPVKEANKWAAFLKKEKKCNMVICLSHLGYRYNSDKVSDILLAERSEHIDLILGGHTHTFMDSPGIVTNNTGNEVIVSQAGWAGLVLGRLDYSFDKSGNPSKPLSTMLKVS